MSTLRPSDNPVDFEKKTTTNVLACGTFLPSMYRQVYVVRLHNERCFEGDPQSRTIPLEKSHFVVKLA